MESKVKFHPYVSLRIIELANRWSASGEIQCEAQLLDDGFTFDTNEM